MPTRTIFRTHGPGLSSDKSSQNVLYQHQFPERIDQAKKVIIKAVQREAFKEEFEVISQSLSENDGSRNEAKAWKKSLSKLTLYQLNPYVDDAGILRVGGRLCQTNLSFNEKHPVLLPKGYHVPMLILHYHN